VEQSSLSNPSGPKLLGFVVENARPASFLKKLRLNVQYVENYLKKGKLELNLIKNIIVVIHVMLKPDLR